MPAVGRKGRGHTVGEVTELRPGSRAAGPLDITEILTEGEPPEVIEYDRL